MPEKKSAKKSVSRAPKKYRKKKEDYLWPLLGIVFVVFFAGIVYLSWEKPVERKKIPKAVPERPKEPKVAKRTETPPVRPKPRIAIIIDDIGNSSRVDDELLSIDAPLTLSVFPLLPESQRVSQKASSSGKEVMLHIPMEPYDYPQVKVGEGALMTSMDDIAIITQLYENLNSVAGIKGVNNHMGSRFTEDSERMRIVLKLLKDKGLYFIDSKTSNRSQSDKIARELGMKAAARDVFLDNEQDQAYIEERIEELKRVAMRRGAAIGIGHPYPATIEALKKAIPLMQKDFEIVPASKLVK